MFHKLTIVGILLRILCCIFFPLTIITFAFIFIGQGLVRDLLAFEVSGSQRIAIYIADPNYGLAVDVTRNSVDNREPIWTSDGHLIFVSGTNSNHDVYSLTLNQLDAINLSNTSRSHNPVWSSSGRLAYLTEQYPQPNRIDIVDQDGSVQSYTTNLFPDLISIEFLSWLSEDQLVFLGGVRGFQKQVFVVGLEDKTIQNISNNPNHVHVDPKTSPKGDMVAFISYDPSNPLGEQYIWMWRKSYQTLQLIASNNGQNGDLAWSNDGRLAFASNFSGNFEIYMWNSETNILSNITNNDSFDANPSWSYSGQIAFISDRMGKSNVYVVNPETQVIEQIFSLRQSGNPVWSK